MKKNYLFAIAMLLTIFNVQSCMACMTFSSYGIEKHINFFGKKINVFLTKPITNFIIEILGPLKDYNVTKKKLNLGVWLDSEHFEIKNAHSVYFVGYNLDEAAAKNIYASTLSDIGKGSEKIHEYSEFLNFFQKQQEKGGVFSLFKLSDNPPSITIPENAPIGTYNINLYEVRDGKSFWICKKELGVYRHRALQEVYLLSKKHNILYTISIVITIILISLTANKLFRR